MNQSLVEKPDVEDVPPVALFFGQQKVEQEGCDTSTIERFRDLNVAWAETARSAAMGEDNQGSGSRRMR
jgi:hypothetical protein